MADDIDDLLDEVEDTFIKKTKTGKKAEVGAICSKNATPKGSSTKLKHGADDLDGMIDDIMGNDGEDLKDIQAEKCKIQNNSSHRQSQKSGNSRCLPIYLGGCSTSLGLATAVNKRACDQLRCTDCDFAVSTFENYQWDKSTDYLFLRNNMPDFDRLKSKLLPRKGNRAYACQCQWLNVKDMKLLQDERQLKWFCGKH